MSHRFEGRRIFVTGGGTGIGPAAAARLDASFVTGSVVLADGGLTAI